MFGRLYVGELKKQTSPGAIITLTVIAVVLAILMAVLFSAFNDLINTMTYGTADVGGFDEDFNVDIDVVLPGQEQTTNGESSQGTVYSPETVEFMLSSLREALAEAEAEKAGLDRLDIQTDDERNTTLAFVTLTDGERDFAFYRHDTADYHIDLKHVDFSAFPDLHIVHLLILRIKC